jgi:molybdate transport system substrate-binding protein
MIFRSLTKPCNWLVGLLLTCVASSAQADSVAVAVAANMLTPMQTIAKRFEQDTGHTVALTAGATGKLYAQITHGGPWQLLLAADDTTGPRLIEEGRGVAGSHRIYALGRLVLWSASSQAPSDGPQVLRQGQFDHLAIANPRVAPYGAAAVQVLQALGLPHLAAPTNPAQKPKLVQGESIAQAYQFVATGHATWGFVALSQVMQEGRVVRGSAWVVPSHLHSPLRQGVVLLKPGEGHAAAQALLAYLQSPAAQQVLRQFGYDLPSP